MLKTSKKFYSLIFFVCLLIMPLMLTAQASATAQSSNHHLESVQKQLIKDGFDAEKIKRLYSRPQVFFEPKGITYFFTYSEAKVDYDQFANDWSIRKAKEFMTTHHGELNRVEAAYGVEGQVITAILLVETGLGTSLGNWSTLNILSTMAALTHQDARNSLWKAIPSKKRIPRKQYEKKAKNKSKWAYKELKAFLTYAYKEGLDPAVVPGSIAGAIGYAQFMPTSILAYGKDGNDDGTIDLNTHADAMASIANYLKRHGWRPGISRKKAEKVIYHYNHSDYYVNIVLKIADLLKG
jgi:membrane-bound lytic murein transglycosylase B